MNVNFVLEQVRHYLNDNNEISEEEFFELFSGFESDEQNEIQDILRQNNIFLVKNKKNNNKRKILIRHTYGKLKVLKKISNEKLCILHQQGDSGATEVLVERNTKFIYKTASKMFKQFKQHNFEFEDLFNEGVLGLLEAADRFDFLKGYKFLTYAMFWIKQRIRRSIIDNAYTIRIPVHLFELLRKIYNIRKNDPNIKIEELALQSDLSMMKVKECLIISEMVLETRSLNELISDESGTEIIDYVSGDIHSTEYLAIKNIEKYQIRLILNTYLKKKEFEILDKRFGIKNNYTMTLDEIGKNFNVTRERIRQIESKALQRLKRFRSKELIDYYKD